MNQSDFSCHLDIKAEYAEFFGPLPDKMSGEQAVLRPKFWLPAGHNVK